MGIEQTVQEMVTEPSQRSEGGELLVVGSGICLTDITSEIASEISGSDVVLHCVWDILTKLWISARRPDAIDLTALYKEGEDRNYTYIQMTEVILHHVRRGKRVLAIFYGHPGIFATSPHQAVRAARKEGYKAAMRPGVSALDHLVADLGVDPAIPGMLNYEASDLLANRRLIDPSLHLVIWQVGLVGDVGWSANGFSNEGLASLLSRLEESYGPSWPIINYVASNFPTVEPLIEIRSIAEFSGLQAGGTVQALSTFYLPPQGSDCARLPSVFDCLTTDTHQRYLGQPTTAYDAASIAHARRRLHSFTVRPGHDAPRPTRVSEFLLSLFEDRNLLRRFKEEPNAVLGGLEYQGLTEREKRLLSIFHPSALDAALAEASLSNG